MKQRVNWFFSVFCRARNIFTYIASYLFGLLLVETAAFADDFHPIGWEEVFFEGETDYQFKQVKQTDENQAEYTRWAVLSHSRQSASGWIYKKKIDLEQTPLLTWSWKKIQGIQSNVDEQSKDGDDFVARVYVIKKGFFPWQTLAISYVWSRQYPMGTVWPNPYTSNAMMVVVESGDDLGWKQYKRNIKEDFERYFNKKVDSIDGVAFMTDTDNTKTSAKAAYRDIHFQEK